MEKHPARNINLDVIELIASQWIDDHNPNSEFNLEMREISERSIAAGNVIRDNLAEEKQLYFDLVEEHINSNSDLPRVFRLPMDLYSPLVTPEISHIEHPLRKAEERYLLKKLRMDSQNNSIENWALIGMALASKEKDNPVKILFKDEWSKSNKGRPSKGLSIDYERAVWKLMIDCQAVELAEKKAAFFNKGKEEYTFAVTIYTLTELLDGYLYAFENESEHEHMTIFNQLEAKLKMRFISRGALLTSFNRGEKERSAKWDS